MHWPYHQSLSCFPPQNLYESIKSEPFKIPEDDGNDLTHTFFNPDREGWLLKLGQWRRTPNTLSVRHVSLFSLLCYCTVPFFFLLPANTPQNECCLGVASLQRKTVGFSQTVGGVSESCENTTIQWLINVFTALY